MVLALFWLFHTTHPCGDEALALYTFKTQSNCIIKRICSTIGFLFYMVNFDFYTTKSMA